jgi:hypothetical protein
MPKTNIKYETFPEAMARAALERFGQFCRVAWESSLTELLFRFDNIDKGISVDLTPLGTQHIAINPDDANLVGKSFQDIRIQLEYVWQIVNLPNNIYIHAPLDPHFNLDDPLKIMPKGFWILYPKAGWRFLSKYRRIMENELDEIREKILSIIDRELDLPCCVVDF